MFRTHFFNHSNLWRLSSYSLLPLLTYLNNNCLQWGPDRSINEFVQHFEASNHWYGQTCATSCGLVHHHRKLTTVSVVILGFKWLRINRNTLKCEYILKLPKMNLNEMSSWPMEFVPRSTISRTWHSWTEGRFHRYFSRHSYESKLYEFLKYGIAFKGRWLG